MSNQSTIVYPILTPKYKNRKKNVAENPEQLETARNDKGNIYWQNHKYRNMQGLSCCHTKPSRWGKHRKNRFGYKSGKLSLFCANHHHKHQLQLHPLAPSTFIFWVELCNEKPVDTCTTNHTTAEKLNAPLKLNHTKATSLCRRSGSFTRSGWICRDVLALG